MANLQDFQKNQTKKAKASKSALAVPAKNVKKKTKALGATRRPYKDTEVLKTKEQKMATAQTEQMTTETSTADTHGDSSTHADSDPKKVEISFFGSEILRAKWSKPFAVAEKVATDWVHGGNFENLEIGNPLADSLATRGLQKAKQVEKQVLESPAFEKATVTAFTWGMKINQEIQHIRDQVKSKLGK